MCEPNKIGLTHFECKIYIFFHEKSFEHIKIIFFRSKFGENVPIKKTLTQHPPSHHAGWMVWGRETILHCIPIQLIMVVNHVLTIHMNVLLLTLHLISWYICSVNTFNVIGFFKSWMPSLLMEFSRLCAMASLKNLSYLALGYSSMASLEEEG
jgi:hypothetical protein